MTREELRELQRVHYAIAYAFANVRPTDEVIAKCRAALEHAERATPERGADA